MTTHDTDGMPLAPASVLTTRDGAYTLFGPAMDQATSWHTPTPTEKHLTTQLLTNFHLSTLNGISSTTTGLIMQAADGLGLQVCRVKTTKTVGKTTVPDSYLLVYTKPGVKDYSGAFFMLRETKHSRFVIYSPHDDSDGTAIVTKLGLSNSYALATISSGHRRGKIGGGFSEYRASDFAHSVNNLGCFAVEQFATLFPGSACFTVEALVCPVHLRQHLWTTLG